MIFLRFYIFCTILFYIISFKAFTHTPPNAEQEWIVNPGKIKVFPPSQKNIQSFIEQNEALVIAYPIPLHADFLLIANAYEYNDFAIFKLLVHAQQAESINTIFSDVKLPKSAKLYVYSTDSTIVHGPYTKKNNNSHGFLATPIVESDSLIISLHISPTEISQTSLRINQISYGFANIQSTLKSGTLKSSGYCNININCPEAKDWKLEKRSVCRLLISGTTLCTGVMLNNTNNDGTPYVLTANHCISNENQANTTVFYFNYEYASCENTGNILNTNTLSGSFLRATPPNERIDYSLVEIEHTPPNSFYPYYAGWDIRETMQAHTSSIHHPRGDAKKISISSSTPTNASFHTYERHTHWRVSSWDLGTTESGSSGGPLFNAQKKVIGTLSGGQATCENPVNDYFSKISSAFNTYSDNSHQIRYWLDPLQTNKLYLSGYNPLHVNSNVNNTDSLTVWNFGEYALGYFGGANEIWTSTSEKFPHTENNHIISITFALNTQACSELSNIKILVWEGTEKPERIMYSTMASQHELIDSQFLFITPEYAIKTTENFWVGYEFIEKDTCTSFLFTTPSEQTNNSLYIHNNIEWFAASHINSYKNMGVEIKITTIPDTLSNKPQFSPPSFSSRIYKNNESFYSKELFAYDSIPGIYDTTKLIHLSTQNNITDWGKAEIFGAECIANKYEIKREDVIRSIKFGIREVPSLQGNTYYAIWDSEQNLIKKEYIHNAKLTQEAFNQVHFSKPVPVNDVFYAGLCYDTLNQGISLYTYFKNNIRTSSYFKSNTMWFNYADYDVHYNFAIQPIVCFSQHHFNRYKDSVLQYPIIHSENKEFLKSTDFIVYPSVCNSECYIRWKQAVHKELLIELFNAHGVSVHKETITFTNGAYPIQVGSLPSGVYILKIYSSVGTFEKKIIISR